MNPLKAPKVDERKPLQRASFPKHEIKPKGWAKKRRRKNQIARRSRSLNHARAKR